MSKKVKVWLIAAASLVLVGSILFGGIMTMLGWDFSKLSISKLVTNTHIITEDFHNISVAANTADVTFVPAEDGNISVVCEEFESEKHTVSVQDGTLVIEPESTRKWYQHIGFHFGKPKITVRLPIATYGALTVRNSTGDVHIPGGFTFGELDIAQSTGDIRIENTAVSALKLKVSTGKVTVSGVTCSGDIGLRVSTGKANIVSTTCRNLTSEGDTGDLTMENVIAAEKIAIDRDTGDIRFTDCDAAEIFVETDTGDVTGSLLSEKVFIAESDTGKVDVPKSATGGRCEIETDTGNIRITVK